MSKERTEKKNKKKGKAGKIIRTVISSILTIILVIVMVVADTQIPVYGRMINSFLGYRQSFDNSSVKSKGLNLKYNESDYAKDKIKGAEQDLDEQIAGEGIVLLKNDKNTMPFAKGTKFSFFGHSSVKFAAGGMLGGGSDLKTSFENKGFGVNEDLWKFYSKGKGSKYSLGKGSVSFGDAEDFSINECPLSVIKEEKGLTDTFKGTVPVFVLKRVAGEGRDMPRSMYNHADNQEDQNKSYLEPDSKELEVLKYLNDNFDNVVVIVNTASAVELDWLKKFENIHSVLFVPAAGTYGLNSLADIFAGTINPSGKTVDTFAVNALNSPAAQNFGDYAYYTKDGKQTKYNYVSYKEGIYVGYKYYETRYEDAVLGQGNAGKYNYTSEVCYPFGYGLSYTTFKWSNYKTSWKGTTCTVNVDVTNAGNKAGKDVVEIYAQSPYTAYDKQNKVEKASVELVGYGKTSELAPGKTETVAVTFNQDQLKAYDYTKAKTYILDAGEYYITAANNSHAAINNILTAKGKTTANGMTEAGNTEMVATYNPQNAEVDSTTYSADSYSGAKITNQFDEAKSDSTYLSRQDWTGTWPTHDGKASNQISTWGNEINGKDTAGKPASFLYYKTISKDLLAKIDSNDSLSPVDKSSFNDKIVYNADNGLKLIDMRGLKYDDPLWNKLLDELSPRDYQETITKSGYGTTPIKSIGKPFGTDADTATGLIYGGTGMSFCSVSMLAQTWNQKLAESYGKMIGNEAILGGATGWYAPSMNIHRTPFSGRNGEYYSEDGFLSGCVGSLAVKGAASKGVYAFIKHFALNDQENHRGDRKGQYSVCTWSNEQAIREIYLKPFEMCMKVGNVPLNYVAKDQNGNYVNKTTEIRACQAVMTAFNRAGYTWTGGSYPLITGILRNEWGFNGFIMTDNANTGVFMDAYQMIEAGADVKLTNLELHMWQFDKDNVADYHYGRQAMHHYLYTIANSKAMNGAMPGSVYKQGIQMSQIILAAINVISIALILLMAFLTVRRFRKKTVHIEVKE
jgi:Beta-glucosidase-related glycosidases